MGGKAGGSGETGIGRPQASRFQKGGGEDGTSEGGEEGCRPEGGTQEGRPGKDDEGFRQEVAEEVGFGHCSTHRGGGISADAGSRGIVGFVHCANFCARVETVCESHQQGRDG
jgi:hypothetical protein